METEMLSTRIRVSVEREKRISTSLEFTLKRRLGAGNSHAIIAICIGFAGGDENRN
jgi:hypothetical protein